MTEKPNRDENLTSDDLEREKLRLEIVDLKHEISRVGRIVKLVPVLTTLVAVGGLVFSFYGAQRAQKVENERRHNESIERERTATLDRINKIQAQIRTDKEQILEFGINDKISPIRAGFLIEDLRIGIEQLPKAAETEKLGLGLSLEEDAKKAVAELLSRIAWDLSFDQKGDFLFDVQALRRLDDYKQSWINYKESHDLFLERKYFSRIRKLHDENATCLEKLDYEENTPDALDYTKARTRCKEDLIDALIYGFGERLTAMKKANQSELLKTEMEKFSRLTNNSAFAKKLSARLGQ